MKDYSKSVTTHNKKSCAHRHYRDGKTFNIEVYFAFQGSWNYTYGIRRTTIQRCEACFEKPYTSFSY